MTKAPSSMEGAFVGGWRCRWATSRDARLGRGAAGAAVVAGMRAARPRAPAPAGRWRSRSCREQLALVDRLDDPGGGGDRSLGGAGDQVAVATAPVPDVGQRVRLAG